MTSIAPSQRDPVLGWRLWRLRWRSLESWAMPSTWAPGVNRAVCLDPTHTCVSAPGKDCQCGYWALWSPLRCLARGRARTAPDGPVLGLVSAWGDVALHGTEGFRAEQARIMCLFTDWPGNARVVLPEAGRVSRWVQRVAGRWFIEPSQQADPDRLSMLLETGDHYGVPVMSLGEALDCHLLGEWGVPTAAVEEVGAWTSATSEGRPVT